MPLPIITAAVILRKPSCCGCLGVSFFLFDFTTSIIFGNGVTFCMSYPFTDIIYKNRIKHNHGLIKVKSWLFSGENKWLLTAGSLVRARPGEPFFIAIQYAIIKSVIEKY